MMAHEQSENGAFERVAKRSSMKFARSNNISKVAKDATPLQYKAINHNFSIQKSPQPSNAPPKLRYSKGFSVKTGKRKQISIGDDLTPVAGGASEKVRVPVNSVNEMKPGSHDMNVS